MLLHVRSILNLDELLAARESLLDVPWEDGRLTAGEQSARAKNNLQLREDCAESRSVRALILRDLAMLAPLGADSDDLSSMLVLEDGILHRESEAVLRVAARLRSPWRWLALMSAIPGPVRDAIYRHIGRRRYEWWGRVSADTCALRDESTRRRFL